MAGPWLSPRARVGYHAPPPSWEGTLIDSLQIATDWLDAHQVLGQLIGLGVLLSFSALS